MTRDIAGIAAMARGLDAGPTRRFEVAFAFPREIVTRRVSEGRIQRRFSLAYAAGCQNGAEPESWPVG